MSVDIVTIGSLFSGIGGLELGVETAFAEAGIPVRVAWQVEIEPYPRAVLARHWPLADRSVTDVRAAGIRLLPRVDVLVGGPPCQDISGAGKMLGVEGERSGLLYEYLRIVGELRPRVCIVENVHSGRWREWLRAMQLGFVALSYSVDAYSIHASDVGAPHRRARIFVVAYANGGDLGGELGRRWPRGRDLQTCAFGCGKAMDDSNGERESQPQGSEPNKPGWPRDPSQSALANADDRGLQGRDSRGERAGGDAALRSCEALADTDDGRLEGLGRGGVLDREREARGDHVDRRDGAPLGFANGSRWSVGSGACGNRAGLAEPAHDGFGGLGDAGRERRERAGGEGLHREGCEDGSPDAGGRIGEVESSVGRRPDGLPSGLALPTRWPAGRGEAQRDWEPPRTIEGRHAPRRAALKAYGNGVVPHVAREAGRLIVGLFQ